MIFKPQMIQSASRTIIHAPADAIWQVIVDFGAADQYLAGVVNCTVEGEGVGARRRLTHLDGTTQLSSASKSSTKRPSG
jgi:carbon monoxide dehydrogenase subunit G